MSNGDQKIVGHSPDWEDIHPSARYYASATTLHERMELERFSTRPAYMACFKTMSGLYFVLHP